MMQNKIRPLAFYLPQFHPIPENNAWWEPGFTEWTNVAKAKPLFKGHWQPRLPADLGFYDLRVPEVREAQAALAKQYGIEGFCYWHYWFGGKRLLERPFNEVVKSGSPKFPFCLAWANQTWEGKWYGLSKNKLLIKQTYPGIEDIKNHFYSLLESFQDSRYIKVDGKNIFFIFQPIDIPEPKLFIQYWNSLAIKEGLKGFHFVAMHSESNWNYSDYGYDAITQRWPTIGNMISKNYLRKRQPLSERLLNKKQVRNKPLIISYQNYVKQYPEQQTGSYEYPVIYADWDSTPRGGKDGWLFEGTTPELFGEISSRAFKQTSNKQSEEKFVLIKSWNEWAEGNYLEPDAKHGTAYLEEFKRQLDKYNDR